MGERQRNTVQCTTLKEHNRTSTFVFCLRAPVVSPLTPGWSFGGSRPSPEAGKANRKIYQGSCGESAEDRLLWLPSVSIPYLCSRLWGARERGVADSGAGGRGGWGRGAACLEEEGRAWFTHTHSRAETPPLPLFLPYSPRISLLPPLSPTPPRLFHVTVQ